MGAKDIVLREAEAGEGIKGLAKAIVEMLGLSRKRGASTRHEKLLIEFVRMRRKNIPLSIEDVKRILGVSLPQAYYEMRKWKEIGLVEMTKVPAGDDFIKGFMLSAPTLNRSMDRVEYRVKSLLRKARMVAKQMDDMMAVENLKKDG